DAIDLYGTPVLWCLTGLERDGMVCTEQVGVLQCSIESKARRRRYPTIVQLHLAVNWRTILDFQLEIEFTRIIGGLQNRDHFQIRIDVQRVDLFQYGRLIQQRAKSDRRELVPDIPRREESSIRDIDGLKPPFVHGQGNDAVLDGLLGNYDSDC